MKVPLQIKRIDYCNLMLKRLHNEFREVQKNPNKSSLRRINFLEQMSNTFDISQDDSLKMLGSIDAKSKQLFLSQPIHDINSKLKFIKEENELGI